MNEKIHIIIKNDTWTLTNLPKSKKTFGKATIRENALNIEKYLLL